MKRTFSILGAALAVFCFLLAVACKHEPDNTTHTDTAFLEGTWTSMGTGAFTFTITDDLANEYLTFECTLVDLNAKISGILNPNGSKLGPNDYFLQNLQTIEDDTYTGNATIAAALGSMNGIIVTVTPKLNNTRFTFSSANPVAKAFFGGDGDFQKQP